MIWLSKDMVEAFHRESLVRFGGSDGLRDEGLMLSALSRPENIQIYKPEADIFRLAAAYCTGIVKNHPFIDGNKRTGVLCAVVFLGINGVELAFDEAEIVAMIYGLAASEVAELQLENWLRNSVSA
jgi:death on curing protein